MRMQSSVLVTSADGKLESFKKWYDMIVVFNLSVL